jgi:hypothetical protein
MNSKDVRGDKHTIISPGEPQRTRNQKVVPLREDLKVISCLGPKDGWYTPKYGIRLRDHYQKDRHELLT